MSVYVWCRVGEWMVIDVDWCVEVWRAWRHSLSAVWQTAAFSQRAAGSSHVTDASSEPAGHLVNTHDTTDTDQHHDQQWRLYTVTLVCSDTCTQWRLDMYWCSAVWSSLSSSTDSIYWLTAASGCGISAVLFMFVMWSWLCFESVKLNWISSIIWRYVSLLLSPIVASVSQWFDFFSCKISRHVKHGNLTLTCGRFCTFC